jgi:hypothetical protein
VKRVEIEMFSETINCPVVRILHRKFPGVVLQGDSLRILLHMAEGVCALSAGAPKTELIEAAAELRVQLELYVSIYEETMQAHGLELPYSKPK